MRRTSSTSARGTRVRSNARSSRCATRWTAGWRSAHSAWWCTPAPRPAGPPGRRRCARCGRPYCRSPTRWGTASARPSCCWSRPPGRATRSAPGSRTSPSTWTPWTATPGSASASTPATSSRPDRTCPSTAVRRPHSTCSPGPPNRLRLIHANDSKAGCGSHLDRHANIGAGEIGAEPFAELFRHPSTDGVPLILETPDRSAPEGFGHQEDVTTLAELRSRQGR
jgi:hypothetical protein